MEMQDVKSSNVAQIGHEGSKMRVKFRNGSVYEYDGVDRDSYRAVRDGESVGRAYNKTIRGGGFESRKVEFDEDGNEKS